MGVLDSSYIKTIGVKSPGHKKIFFILSDTLLYSVQLYSIILYCKTECKLGGHIMETFVELTPPAKDAQLGFFLEI